MTKVNLKKEHLCNVCDNYACYHDGKLWWCSLTSDIGTYNMKGVCKHDKEKRKKTRNKD
jgi:hypothetical protein